MLATSDKQVLSYPPTPIRFKTFPDPKLPHSTPFRFIVSSCMKPNFPYAPFEGDRIRGMDLLADYLWPRDSTGTTVPPTTPPQRQGEHLVNPLDKKTLSMSAEFMLFLGDFVYADVPHYFGDNLDAYRRLYRRNYRSPSFRRVYERLRRLQLFTFYLPLLRPKLAIFFTYDDHEFINNYAGSSRDSGPYLNGSQAFFEYNAQTNFNSPDENQFYYEFSYGTDAAFFVMDTRRHRSAAGVKATDRSMLGATQLGTFFRWLSKVRLELTTNYHYFTHHDPGEFNLDVQVRYYLCSVYFLVDARRDSGFLGRVCSRKDLHFGCHCDRSECHNSLW